MKLVPAVAVAAFVMQAGAAMAEWQTVAIPGMDPIMIGSESQEWALVVACTSDADMTIAYIENNATASTKEGGTIGVQADTDQHYTFEATRYPHNDQFTGYKSTWTDYATIAVEAIGWASNTVTVYLKHAGETEETPRTLSAAGAANAVSQLLGVCGIQ